MASATFRYTARTLDGKSVCGSMHAADTGAVLALLRSRALVATSIDRESDLGGRLRGMLRAGGISHAALVAFFRSFVTLIRAGVPIQRSLEVTIERCADGRLTEALRSVLADVENGSALSDALGRRPREFPVLYVAMVRAGEAGGILDDVLERLAVLLERESALRKSIRTALAYPAIVLVCAAALIVFVIAKIVPMFADVFAGFHLDLPLPTRLLLELGHALATPFPWLAAALALPAAALAVIVPARTPRGALLADAARLRAPVIGPLLQRAIMARVARLLATLLRSGVELVAAIDAVIPVCGSPQYAQAFERANVALRAGEPLAAALDAGGRFDPLFTALVHVGEETGAVDEMLLRAALSFEADLEATIATLGAVVEPALIVILGGIVGFIVLSIFLPLYSLIGGVSK